MKFVFKTLWKVFPYILLGLLVGSMWSGDRTLSAHNLPIQISDRELTLITLSIVGVFALGFIAGVEKDN